MEGGAPGWKGHLPRPQRNGNAANQCGMGRCRLHTGTGPHSTAEGIAFISDSLLAELEQADEYVIGVPMHNFGVPSVLKLWIDQIARVGRTFAYSEKGPKGLITGKKATFIIATGGIYDAQTRMASFNFVEPYLRSVFGFLGVTDATFLTAGGTSALNQGKDRNTFLAPHLQAVQTHAQTF